MSAVVPFVALLVSLNLLFGVTQPGYKLMFVLPLLYCVVFSIFLNPVLKKNIGLFAVVFALVGGLRYVILPYLIYISEYYHYGRGIRPDANSLDAAMLLMGYELLAAGAVFFIVFGKVININEVTLFGFNRQKNKESRYVLPKYTAFYWVFFVIVLMLVILTPSSVEDISVFVPKDDISRNVYAKESLLYGITVYGLTIAKQLIFILAICALGRRYVRTKSLFIAAVAVMLVCANSFVYYNSGRLDILITTVVSGLVFVRVFRIKRILPLMVLFSVALISILVMISIVRSTSFISKADSVLVDITDMVNVYVGGPYNVAMAIETAEVYPESRGLPVFLYDVFRPMLGVNMLLKDLPAYSSNYYFNLRIFGGSITSQIIPMVGQGYLFFGYMGAPLLTVLFVWIAGMLGRYVSGGARIEVVYFISLALVKLGFIMGQGVMNMVNYLSLHLFLFFVVYYINNKSKQMSG